MLPPFRLRGEREGGRDSACWLCTGCTRCTTGRPPAPLQISAARVQVALGESVRVVGSGEALGEWDAHRGVQLQWSEGHVWRASAALPAESKVSFKFVKLSQDGGFVEWEEGEDRTVALLDIAEPAVELLAAWEEPGVVSGVEELRGAVCAVSGIFGMHAFACGPAHELHRPSPLPTHA